MAEQKETFKSFVEKCVENCNCNAETNTANQAKVLVSKLAEKLDSYSARSITWDGVVGNRPIMEDSSGVSFVKVSDDVFTAEDLIGATVTYVLNGKETTAELSEADVIVADDGHIIVSSGLDPIGLVLPSADSGYETGTYFFYLSAQGYSMYTTSLETQAKEIDVRIPAENITMPEAIVITLDENGNCSSNGTYAQIVKNIQTQGAVYYKEYTATYYRVMTGYAYTGDGIIDLTFSNSSNTIRVKSDGTIALAPAS